MKKETTPTVDAIGQIHIEGNTIPSQWFKRIQHSGKPDAIAVILLGEVFYWYRPTVIRDEATGEVKEIRRKFDKDKWQCSYQSLADRFGFTKRQATDAAKRLRDAGLITMEFRNFKSDGGIFLSNVLYIEPVPDKIRAITFESDTPSVATEPILRSSVTPPTPKEGTYTETPTETPTDKEKESSGQKPPAPPEPPKAEKPVKAKADLFPVVTALSEVCQMPFEINRGRLFREAKQLCAAAVVPPVTPDEVRARYGAGSWWYREDWRGQKGEPPTPAAIRGTWGQWTVPKVIPFKRDTKAAKLADTFARWDAEAGNGNTTNHNGDPQEIFECVSFTVT